MIREVFERGSTGDASAREMAEAWAEASDYLRKRFNAAGGRIPKRKDWGLPQVHDTLAVRKATFQEWRDFIQPRLDSAR
jgi:ATP-dependent Zn protease